MCMQLLVGKSEGGRQLGTSGCSLEDNIKVDLKEVRWGVGVDLIVLPHDTKSDGFLSTR